MPYPSQVRKYPSMMITDWGGTLIDPEIRRHLGVGNVVRIGMSPMGEPEVSNTVYFRITEKVPKRGWFKGVVEDPYNGRASWFAVKDGETRKFSVHHVMEIPLDWEGNKHLRRFVRYRNKARMITGV